LTPGAITTQIVTPEVWIFGDPVTVSGHDAPVFVQFHGNKITYKKHRVNAQEPIVRVFSSPFSMSSPTVQIDQMMAANSDLDMSGKLPGNGEDGGQEEEECEKSGHRSEV